MRATDLPKLLQGEIKHAFIQLRDGKALSAHEHINHCIEYLRQVYLSLSFLHTD
jgi:hypothetical protein